MSGIDKVKTVLDRYVEAKSCQDKAISDLVVGFDMVDIEDQSENLSFFAQYIIDASNKLKEMGIDEIIPCFFHAGESNKNPDKSFNL